MLGRTKRRRVLIIKKNGDSSVNPKKKMRETCPFANRIQVWYIEMVFILNWVLVPSSRIE